MIVSVCVCACVRVQVANRRRSGPTSPSGTQQLQPNSAPTAVSEPVDSPTSLADWLADWFGTIAVTIAIVAVTTWLVLGGCGKRKQQGLTAANEVTLQQEIERVYRADGSGRVGGLDEGPTVSATDYRLAISQWPQHLGSYLPNVHFSDKLPIKSRLNGKQYKIKPGAKEFPKNDTEISTGIPRCRDCTLEHLCEAALAKATEAAPKGSSGLVPMEYDLLRPAIINVVELAANVGVRQSYLEGAEGSINARLSTLMRRHREAAPAGASTNRFSVALLGPTADVSVAARSAAAVAQAGKSLTSIAADARSSDARHAGCAGNGRILGPNASAEEVAARQGWVRSKPDSLAQRAENIANGSYPAWLKKKNDASPQALVDRAKRIADGTYPACWPAWTSRSTYPATSASSTACRRPTSSCLSPTGGTARSLRSFSRRALPNVSSPARLPSRWKISRCASTAGKRARRVLCSAPPAW